MPRFSIVVTTTRPRLVQHALRSALAQTFADFEVVVSDNSDEGCRALIDSFADPRLRYVRPEGYFTVVPHWNFAFAHATGEWQLLLCDDDAITPDLLAILDKEIRERPGVDSIGWFYANYASGEDGHLGAVHRLNIPGHTGSRIERSTREIIALMFDCGAGLATTKKREVPIAPAAAYSKRVIDRVRAAWNGDLFRPICPMTTGALAVLALSDRTLRIDLPLTVLGQTADSAAGHLRDATTFKRMNAGASFAYAPMPFTHLFPSVTLESLLSAQAALPQDKVGHYRIDWVEHFLVCWDAIRQIGRAGSDASELTRAWDEQLRRYPAAVRDAVAARIADERPATARRLFDAVAIRARHRLARAFRGTDAHGNRSIDTAALGLGDVTDCARYLAATRA